MSENDETQNDQAIAGSDDKLHDDGRPSPGQEDSAKSEEGHHDPETSEDTVSGGAAD